MALMADRSVSEADYRSALRETAVLRDHRLNSLDKTVWWRVAHDTLVEHHARPGETVCAECDEAWPCMSVKAVVADVRSGNLGY